MATPFLSITLHEITAQHVQENDWWPGNTAIELYQTWQLSELESVQGTEKAGWARQGFSTKGGLRGYTRFHDGDTRTVIDPQITLALNPELLPKDDFRRLELRFHHWEQNDTDATQKVRTLFSDPSMQQMIDAWAASNGNSDRAKRALEDWVGKNWQSIAGHLIEMASPAAAGIVSTLNLLPFLGLVVDVARNQADRYFSEDRIIISLQSDAQGRVLWKIDGPGLPPGEIGMGQGMREAVTQIQDPDGSNRLQARYRVRIIS
jgi:hypothetical protein